MKQERALSEPRKALAACLIALCCIVLLGLAGCGSSSGSSAASSASQSASASASAASGSAQSASASASASAANSASQSASASAAAGDMVSFTDSAGRTVQVPANIERLVVTGPISQMAMFVLAPEKMVGLSNELNEFEIKYVAKGSENLPVLGQIYGGKGDFNKEAVANADPQVIIDIGEAKKTIVEDLDEIQAAIGIPCVHIEATYNTYDQAFTLLGELLGVQDRAKELADYCKASIDSTDAVLAGIPEADRVTVAYLLGDAGLNAMAKGSFQGTVVDAIANNVAVIENAGGSGLGSETSFEQIALWDPAMIIFAPDSIYYKVGNDATWQTLTAISTGNYHVVPGEPYNWVSSPPGINQVLGYQWFAHLCYPDKFTDSMSDTVKNYYKVFYGYNLSDDEYNAILAGFSPKE